jgi:hypothetical protein
VIAPTVKRITSEPRFFAFYYARTALEGAEVYGAKSHFRIDGEFHPIYPVTFGIRSPVQ